MTDSNEPAAWEDINPPATVSAQQAEQRSRSLARLEPAGSEQFRNELTACLALVVPVGMTEEARREWLSVAWITLKHLPPDILASGCQTARETCDHPSKIVPAIVSATAEMMQRRRDAVPRERAPDAPQLPEPNYCTPEEAKQILAEVGLKRNWSE